MERYIVCQYPGCEEIPPPPTQTNKTRPRKHCESHKYNATGHAERMSKALTGKPPLNKGVLLGREHHPQWKGDEIGYSGTHMRVRAERGPATSYPCVDCGDPAFEWSFDHASETVKWDTSGAHEGTVFSPNIMDYSPRCHPCHTDYDSRHNAGRG